MRLPRMWSLISCVKRILEQVRVWLRILTQRGSGQRRPNDERLDRA